MTAYQRTTQWEVFADVFAGRCDFSVIEPFLYPQVRIIRDYCPFYEKMALDAQISPVVKSAFRTLIVASGNTIARRTLLRIIIEDGEKASGIENAIKDKGLKSVAILGVRKTMEGDFYSKILAEHGIRVVIPDDTERAFIHDSIYNELVKNDFRDSTRVDYQDVIRALGLRGADCVALACTEMPLLISPEQSPLPAFSTTELHCQAAVEQALMKR